MSYARPLQPRKVGKPNIVKSFVRGRPARPIQGVAAPRPLRTARVRSRFPGLGDSEDYEYVTSADGGMGAGPVKVRKRAKVGAFGLKKHDANLSFANNTEDYGYVDASLGDDYSDAGGMGNWFTDAISRPFEAIGLTSPDDPTPVEYIKWRAGVIAKGHTVGRMPSGAQAGEWAEIAVVNGQRLYAIAPPAVLAEDAKIAGIVRRQLAAGQAATTGTNILNALKPPNLASSITGIPSWVFPFLIVGGGYMVLKSVLPQQRSA
jgi:hypothetical protein